MTANKKIILLVEDNEVAARVATMLFEFMDCEVNHVKDGIDAVQLAKEKHYNGICLDIGLPTLSGVNACIAIRAYEAEHKLTRVPIIAVTGNFSPDEVRSYLKAGMQDVIAKPLSKEKVEYFLSLCN